MTYTEKANEVVDKIKQYREENEGWKQAKKNKDVTVFVKPSPEWNGALYKSECTVNVDPGTVFRYIEPTPTGPRKDWDKAVKTLEQIEQIDDKISVVRTITRSALGGIISSRDFTDVVVTVETDEFISTNAAAVDHPKCPPSSEHVRGKNYPCGIICFKIPGEPNKTRVESYLQSELGGMLPQSVVENALPSNILDFYSCLKKKLCEDGHLANEHLQNGDS